MKPRLGHVLLVDDDDVDVMALERAFRANTIGASLVVARDGIEALAALRGDGCAPVPRPYVILLDLNLPRMNGIEFLSELRSDPIHKNAVVFVLTTSSSPEDKRAAYDHNVAGYIVKSKAKNDLAPLVKLLEAYWSIVEVP